MIVTATNVTKRYKQKLILDRCSFSIPQRGITAIIGPNSSGKSTLLRLLATLEAPDEGTIELNGTSSRQRKVVSSVAYISDVDGLYDWMTIQQWYRFSAKVYPDFQLDKALAMLADFAVDNETIRTLSKGQKGLVNVIWALSRTTPLLLLDEPLSGIDLSIRKQIISLLVRYADLEQQAIVLTTHEIAEIEPLLDYVILLKAGRIELAEEVETLRERTHQSLATFAEEVFTNETRSLR